MGELMLSDLHLDLEDPQPGIVTLLKEFRPKWETGAIKFERLSGGIVNTLIKVSLITECKESIVFKIYNSDIGFCFNRDGEQAILEEIDSENVTPQLYIRFENGFAYKFADGQTITPGQLMNPHIYRLIIEKMHVIHSIKPKSDICSAPFRPGDMNGLVQSEEFARFAELEIYKDTFPPPDVFKMELEKAADLYDELTKEFPVLLIHGDIQMQNVIYEEKSDSIKLIDWEFAGLCSELRDIVVLLYTDPKLQFEAAGLKITECEEFHQAFLREYLSTHPVYKDGPITDEIFQIWLNGFHKATYVFQLNVVLLFVILWSQDRKSNRPVKIAAFYYKIAKHAERLFEKE